MLLDLLALIENGQQFTQSELAQKLGVNLEMLDSMLDQLMRLGYLEDLSCSTNGHCDSCTLKGGCFAGSSKHVWMLTIKGRHAITHAATH